MLKSKAKYRIRPARSPYGTVVTYFLVERKEWGRYTRESEHRTFEQAEQRVKSLTNATYYDSKGNPCA